MLSVGVSNRFRWDRICSLPNLLNWTLTWKLCTLTMKHGSMTTLHLFLNIIFYGDKNYEEMNLPRLLGDNLLTPAYSQLQCNTSFDLHGPLQWADVLIVGQNFFLKLPWTSWQLFVHLLGMHEENQTLLCPIVTTETFLEDASKYSIQKSSRLTKLLEKISCPDAPKEDCRVSNKFQYK
jgi:hypothetical protein